MTDKDYKELLRYARRVCYKYRHFMDYRDVLHNSIQLCYDKYGNLAPIWVVVKYQALSERSKVLMRDNKRTRYIPLSKMNEKPYKGVISHEFEAYNRNRLIEMDVDSYSDVVVYNYLSNRIKTLDKKHKDEMQEALKNIYVCSELNISVNPLGRKIYDQRKIMASWIKAK